VQRKEKRRRKIDGKPLKAEGKETGNFSPFNTSCTGLGM